MSVSATIPVAQVAQANAELEAQGFGPSNFSVPIHSGPRPSHAALHAWTDTTFEAALKAIPGVQFSDIEGTPKDRVVAALAATSPTAQWGGNALMLEGQVTPGLHRDAYGVLWWVIQAYDTNTWPDPTAIPALVRRARMPGEVLPWVQPLDQFDAYLLSDPFTGQPERVTHAGTEWVTERDLNVWEPGTPDSGWQDVNAVVTPTAEWTAGTSYTAGDVVTYQGAEYECRQSHTAQIVWEPPNVLALWLPL